MCHWPFRPIRAAVMMRLPSLAQARAVAVFHTRTASSIARPPLSSVPSPSTFLEEPMDHAYTSAIVVCVAHVAAQNHSAMFSATTTLSICVRRCESRRWLSIIVIDAASHPTSGRLLCWTASSAGSAISTHVAEGGTS